MAAAERADRRDGGDQGETKVNEKVRLHAAFRGL